MASFKPTQLPGERERTIVLIIQSIVFSSLRLVYGEGVFWMRQCRQRTVTFSAGTNGVNKMVV